MAAVDFFSAFGLKWGQTGNTIVFQDEQYKVGWSFIGDIPPSVEQFNELQQLTDEKANWLFGQLQTAATAKGITLEAANLGALLAVLDAMVPDATVNTKGIAKLASTAEVQAGADTGKIVTSATLATRTATETRTGLIEIATNAEAAAGADTARAVVPSALKPLLDLKLDKAGGTIAGSLTVSVLLGANRIQFPGVQVPSADPTTLDDYREGVYTCNDMSSALLALGVYIRYVKIGRVVTCHVEGVYPTNSDLNNATFSLPFPAASNGAGAVLQGGSGLACRLWVQATDPNRVWLMKNQFTNYCTNSEMSNSTIWGSFSYMTAA